MRCLIWLAGCDTEFLKDIHHCWSISTISNLLQTTFNVVGASFIAVHSVSKKSNALWHEQFFTLSLIVSSSMIPPYTGYPIINISNLTSFFDTHKISRYFSFFIDCMMVLSWLTPSLTEGKLSRTTLLQCCNNFTCITRSGKDNSFTCLPHDSNTLVIERSSRKSKCGQINSFHSDEVSTAVRSRRET